MTYPVSAAFRAAIAAPERRVLGRVVIDYTDWQIDQSLQATANEQAGTSWPAQTADGITEPPRRWASLDGSTLANGLSFPMPGAVDTAQVGWWGSQLAGAGGAFATPLPTLTVTHSARPVWTLLVIGDARREEWPVDFVIRLLDGGGAALHTETVTGNGAVEWRRVISPVVGVARQELIVSRWSHVGRQAKIVEFFTSVQETYEGSDIAGIDLLEEREAASGSLPVGNISANELVVRLVNRDHRFDAGNAQSPLAGLLRQNRRVRAWLGAGDPPEWVPLGTFWTGDWHLPTDQLHVQTTCWDRLELLRQSTYSHSQVFAGTTLHALATTVLQDAGLAASEFWVDPALQTYSVANAWFEPVSHREALRVIAEAGLGQVYADRHGVVRVEGSGYLYGQESFIMPGFAPTQSISLTADEYFRRDTPTKWGELANVVEVRTMPLRAVATALEVFRSNEPVAITAGQTVSLTVHYNERPVIDAVASLGDAPPGATITAAAYYGWGANVSVHSPSGGSFVLVVHGRPLRVLNRERVVAEDAASIRDHGRMTYRLSDNHLLQSTAVAQRVADILLRTFRHPRRDVAMTWRGNPALLLGDVVITPDRGQWLSYWVTRQNLRYNGTLKSHLEGRRAT